MDTELAEIASDEDLVDLRRLWAEPISLAGLTLFVLEMQWDMGTRHMSLHFSAAGAKRAAAKLAPPGTLEWKPEGCTGVETAHLPVRPGERKRHTLRIRKEDVQS